MAVSFVHLHVHSPFSFLDGASSMEALLDRAAALDMPALALTDHDSLSGAVRFAQLARARGIRPIIGAEVTLDPGGYHLTLLVHNRTGYRNLCRLVSHGHLDAPRRYPRLRQELLASHRQGLIALSGCARGEIPSLLRQGQWDEARQAVARYRDWFGPRFFVELQDLRLPGSRRLVHRLVELARAEGVPVVATNDVHFARKADFAAHDVLTCVRTLTRLDDVHPERRLNGENYLKSAQEMASLFQAYPEALTNTLRIADQCTPDVVPLGERLYPAYPTPPGERAATMLRHLTYEGARARYGAVDGPIRQRLEHELQIIEQLGVEDYFLIMWDIVRYARSKGIRATGRGSAADSAVAYCLGLTDVDAIGRGLLFERFLSLERAQAPDIDIDFDARRRDEVAAYVYHRFGPEHVAAVATYQTFRARSAVRDLGKAIGFRPEELDQLASRLPYIPADAIRQAAARLPELRKNPLLRAGVDGTHRRFALLFDLAQAVAGFPRHLGTHLGGLIISREPLADLVPLQMAAKGVVVAALDKEDVEAMGFMKLDLLFLRTLGAIDDAYRLIAADRADPTLPQRLDRQLPLDDPATYAMLHTGDTVGVFQLESPAQRALQGRLQATTIEDIVASVALIRPGPIKGDMVEPFLARRRGLEPITYLHPALEGILKKTYGVVLYQEQVIAIATAIAGFTPGEADRLRRVMTHYRSEKEMEAIGHLFTEKAMARGVTPEVARTIFSYITGYAGYGFCEAHAAAFAHTAYKTAYLMRHFPAEFYAALLNNQPMGFYPPHALVTEARRRGIRVLGPDINRSGLHYRVLALEGSHDPGRSDRPAPATVAIDTPLRAVRHIREATAAQIVADRDRHGPYPDLATFIDRIALPRDALEALVMAGAFDRLHPNRRALLWYLAGRHHGSPAALQTVTLALPLPTATSRGPGPAPAEIPDFSDFEKLVLEFYTLGFSPDKHFLAYLRPALNARGSRVYTVAQARRMALRAEAPPMVRVAGLLIRPHRPPTRSGKTVVFLTLEDETGLLDVTVFESIYQQDGQIIFSHPALLVEGRLQRRGKGAVALIARRIEPLHLTSPAHPPP